MAEHWGGHQGPPTDAGHAGSNTAAPQPPASPGGAGEVLRTIARGALSGGPVVVVGGILFVLFSLAPYYKAETDTGTVAQNCSHIKDRAGYMMCVHRTLGSLKAAANYQWNGWHRLISWPPIVLFLFLALVVAAKGLATRPNKVRLGNKALGLVVVADVLFLIAFYDMPNSYMVRAWGLWVSLILAVFITVGALLTLLDLRPLMDQRPASTSSGGYQPAASQSPPGYQPPPGQAPR